MHCKLLSASILYIKNTAKFYGPQINIFHVRIYYTYIYVFVKEHKHIYKCNAL